MINVEKPNVFFERGQGLSNGTLASLFVHALLLAFSLAPILAPTPPSIPIEKWVEIVEAPRMSPTIVVPPAPPKPKVSEMQMAETEDAGNRELDPNAKILSEHNQRAKEQTRAKLVDDFRAKKGTGAREVGAPSLPPTADFEDSKPLVAEGEGIQPATKSGVKRNWKNLSLKDLSVGAGDGGPLAASDDYLPHVHQADRTILSTREYKFFSYYQRIKELLRQYWKPRIEREVARVISKGRNLSDNELTTRVQVMLDRQGKIQKISRVGSSGIDEIDSAAIQAFEQAGPFPNPPHALVDADGYVRINWDFILQTDSMPRIQFRTAGGAGPGGGGGARGPR